MDGMTAVENGVLQHVADPTASAIRIVNPGPDNPLRVISYTAGFLLQNKSATGIGNILDARANGGVFGAGYWFATVSGNSASAEFLVSHDSANWRLLTATAWGPGSTANGQWSGYYPYIAASAKWISAGAQTASVTLHMSLK